MKKILMSAAAVASLTMAAPAQAEHWDVIAFKLTGQCTFDQYMDITRDFNVWGAQYGYHSKVAMPLQGDDLETYFWVGSSADAATFGGAWDAWRNSLGDPNSTPAKLWARFVKCSTNIRRSGFDVYE